MAFSSNSLSFFLNKALFSSMHHPPPTTQAHSFFAHIKSFIFPQWFGKVLMKNRLNLRLRYNILEGHVRVSRKGHPSSLDRCASIGNFSSYNFLLGSRCYNVEEETPVLDIIPFPVTFRFLPARYLALYGVVVARLRLSDSQQARPKRDTTSSTPLIEAFSYAG